MLTQFFQLSLCLLLSTVSVAHGSQNEEEVEPDWSSTQVHNPSDPGLIYHKQGAGTVSEIDPSCGPCMARILWQKRLGDHTRFSPSRAGENTVAPPQSEDGQQ